MWWTLLCDAFGRRAVVPGHLRPALRGRGSRLGHPAVVRDPDRAGRRRVRLPWRTGRRGVELSPGGGVGADRRAGDRARGWRHARTHVPRGRRDGRLDRRSTQVAGGAQHAAVRTLPRPARRRRLRRVLQVGQPRLRAGAWLQRRGVLLPSLPGHGAPRGPCEHRGRGRQARRRRGGHDRVPEPLPRQGRVVPLDRMDGAAARDRATALRGRARHHRPQADRAVPRDPPRGDAGARELLVERAGRARAAAGDRRGAGLDRRHVLDARRRRPHDALHRVMVRGQPPRMPSGCDCRRTRSPICPAGPTMSGSSRRSPTGCTPAWSSRCRATPTCWP